MSIAPLIDCVLLLLIFFMVTSQFVMQPGLKISLPAASASRPEEGRITVSLPWEGGIYIDGERVEEEELYSRLRQAMRNEPGKSLIVKADQEIPLGRAVRIMDIGKKAGVERMTIATRVEK